MDDKRTIFLAGLGVIAMVFITVGSYAAWYGYERQAKIVHNVECDRTLGKHPASIESGAVALPSCAYEIVPPTLWEKFTGNVPDVLPVQFTSIECDQSATSADCAKLAAQYSSAQSQPLTTSSTAIIGWVTYADDDTLKVRFDVPVSGETRPEEWHIGSGTTGRAFQATIPLPSGAVIYVYATTKDYSVEKDGFPVGTEGFATKGGKYYVIRRSVPSDTPFVPDEVWQLSNGSNALVRFRTPDPTADYPEPPAQALVNLPGPNFTGIGFVLWNKEVSRQPGPDDFSAFKRIVTSIRLMQ